jgi:multidrug efflux pump subunit AcrA (membrane-fusion protein)
MWVTSLYGMVLGPTWRRGQELTRQYRSGKVQVRYIGIIALVIAVVAGLFLMPIDYVIQAPCAVMPARTSTVRTAVSGRIVRVHSHPGQAVKAGEALFEMENPELELDLERMEKRLELAREQRRAAQAAHDLAARQRYDNEVRKVREEVRELEDHVARLVVKAPHDGIVVSLNRRDVHGTPTQHGFVTPLQGVVTVEPQDFVGTVVSPGTGVMAVADQETVRLDMFVPEYDRGFVRVAEETEEASPVQVLLRSLPDALIETVAATRAETDVKTIQNVGLTLADVGWLPVERGPNGELTPQRKLYLVRSALLERAALPGRVALGTTGKANIIYGRGPAGTFYARRIWRNLRMRMQAATGQ